MEQLVQDLDAKVLGRQMAWKSAANIWSLVTKLFDDAQASKTLALRVLDANPCAGVRGPDVGVRKAKQYLYPDEVLAIASCSDVSILWRRRILLATYLGTRAAELGALEWSDVDVERRVVHVHRAAHFGGTTKATKTDAARRIPIEQSLIPLLILMREEVGAQSRVIALPNTINLARDFRVSLERAKVDRAELFITDHTRRAVTFHDLRATCATWMAVRGDEPLKIMQRLGHADFKTTQGYIREAENLAVAIGDPFPELPHCMLGRAPGERRARSFPVVRPARIVRANRPNVAQPREIIVPKVGVEPTLP